MSIISKISVVIIVILLILLGAFYWYQHAQTPATVSTINVADASYQFMGDTFSLQNGSTTIQGHSGLSGAPTDTLVPVGYTLAASTTGDINGDGTSDSVAALYRGFGANLEWVALFGFTNENGAVTQIASSTAYMNDSKVESVSVDSSGVVSLNLFVVSAADQQNLAHYEQVPNQPLTLQFKISDGAFVPVASSTATAVVPGDNLTLGQDSNATVGSYLNGYNGMTLYTYAPDSSGVSKCTGACATTWPPYTVTSTANLVAESPIAGTVSTLTRADGSKQVTYNGHPLYFYSGDSSNGDTKGQGVGGIWYVAKP